MTVTLNLTMLKVALIVIIILLVFGIATWVIVSIILLPVPSTKTTINNTKTHVKHNTESEHSLNLLIDECSIGTHDCEQRCFDTPGSYSCACDVGYVLAKDGRTCLDKDECVYGGVMGDSVPADPGFKTRLPKRLFYFDFNFDLF